MIMRARAPQLAMLDGITKTARHNLIANPGLGKSAAALLKAGVHEFESGSWPGLFILAPLQVCLNWVNEVQLWLPAARTVLVTGDKTKRQAAIKQSADVYLMNYDNLPWLHEYAPADWSCFGRMMVCDEATRLRGTRVSWQTSSTGKRFLRTDGGVQTNALARHAADFRYWLNMTATPVPNGALNWWPLCWYIDAGHRLGNSYSAFEQRWFRVPNRHSDFAKPEPLPGAVEEIAARTSDITTVVRIEDYIDIAQPNFIDRWVELPAKAMKQYREMKLQMFTEIEDGLQNKTISVLTAAAKVSKLNAIACGFTYHEDDEQQRQCTFLHEAKLDAVESIVEETGENQIIFYHHHATLEMLKKRFKKALVELDKAGQAQRDWNAGNIKLLAVQYQRGSMGLSLQHGGRSMIFIEPTYRADDWEQAIERAGPLRQMQSGYNRAVNVYRIMAHGTLDKDIYKRVREKMDLQDLMISLLRS